MTAQLRTKVSDIADTIADIVYTQYPIEHRGQMARNSAGNPLFPPGVDINNVVHLVLMLGDAWEERHAR